MPGGSHLTPEELDSWSDEFKNTFGPRADHVRDCEECELLVSMVSEHEARLRKLRNNRSSPPQPDCPGPETWVRVAAGLIRGEECAGLLEHAAGCDSCGAELRDAAEYVADDSPAPAQKSALPTSDSQRRRGMAAELAKRSRFKRRLRVRYLLPIAAGILISTVAGTWWMMRPSAVETASRLLAQAYDRQPPFEYRIPEAMPGTPVTLRGAEASLNDRPVEMSEAEAKIQREISRRPQDPRWRALMARADLLQGNYDPAIRTLLELRDARPKNADVLNELGRAYAVRATARSDHRQDFESAVENLNRAVQARPGNSEALFNLALLYTNIQQYSNAEEAWKRYLAVDSSGAWADQARKHLDEVVKKKSSVVRP